MHGGFWFVEVLLWGLWFLFFSCNLILVLLGAIAKPVFISSTRGQQYSEWSRNVPAKLWRDKTMNGLEKYVWTSSWSHNKPFDCDRRYPKERLLWSARDFFRQLLLCLQQLINIFCLLKCVDYLLQREMPEAWCGVWYKWAFQNRQAVDTL